MIENNKRLSVYLESVVHSVFKILPLYEEENIGLNSYVDSLIFELRGLDRVVKLGQSNEYIALLSTLSSVKVEITKSDSKKSVIKREIFKSINIVKNMIAKLEDGE